MEEAQASNVSLRMSVALSQVASSMVRGGATRKEHGVLKYPEGTACAAVLKAGASAECRAVASPTAQAEMRAAEAAGLGTSPGAKVIFTGFAIGLLYKTLNVAFKGWKDVPEKVFGAPLKGGSVGAEISPELVGVGYIIALAALRRLGIGGLPALLLGLYSQSLVHKVNLLQ